MGNADHIGVEVSFDLLRSIFPSLCPVFIGYDHAETEKGF